MSNKYVLKRSIKTRILNIFRLLFTWPPFEKNLVWIISRANSKLWQKLVPPEYLYKKGSYRNITRKGITCKLDVSNVVDHYLYFGLPELAIDNVISRIGLPKVIIDVGANIGYTAMHFSSRCKDAKVYAFEPDPDTYSRAVHNLSLNNFSNIFIEKLGLGMGESSFKLYRVNENNPGMNRIISKVEDNYSYVEIKVTSLDKYVEQNLIETVDFIKIDVEGFEFNVIKGALNTLKQYSPILLIELDDNNLKDNNSSSVQLISFLKAAGYNNIIRADTLLNITDMQDFTNTHFDIIAS